MRELFGYLSYPLASPRARAKSCDGKEQERLLPALVWKGTSVWS